MKILKYSLVFLMIAALAISCQKGIDPIEPVSPGQDEDTPELAISFPTEGKVVRSTDEIGTIVFKVVASDDIELKSVVLQLDGVEISNMTSFMDYRRADVAFEYNSLVDGNHVLTATVTDLTDKSATKSVNFKKITAPVYNPLDGEVLFMPFEDEFLEYITGNFAGVEGAPGFAEGKVGSAYAGAADSYLTYPSSGMTGDEFGLCFWYKINAEPVRGGIFAISAEGDSRSTGLRMFRENSGANQNIGLNFGIGDAEVWMNPIVQIPTDQDWMHIAISITSTHATVYVNGEVALETDIATKLDWTGTSSISIGSGAPNFTYWDHFSDLSLYDELHLFKRAITAAEVHGFYAVK